VTGGKEVIVTAVWAMPWAWAAYTRPNLGSLRRSSHLLQDGRTGSFAPIVLKKSARIILAQR
jgi:hypothetical protein